MIFEYTKNGVFLRRFLVFLFCAVFSIFLQRYLIFLVVFSMCFVTSTFLKTIIFCSCVSLVGFLVSFYKIWRIQFRCFFSLSRYWRLFPWLFAFSDLKKAFPILTFFFIFQKLTFFSSTFLGGFLLLRFSCFIFWNLILFPSDLQTLAFFLEFLWAYFGFSFLWCFFSIFYDMFLFFW